MIAVPIAVVLFGYWVLYSGVKRSSLADAWNCVAQQQQTAGQQGSPGDIRIGPGTVTTDCKVRKGDTKLPIPGGNLYMIWRPIGSGVLGQLNGQLLGPCGG